MLFTTILQPYKLLQDHWKQNRCIWHESNICVGSLVGDCISKIGGQSLQEMDDCESVFIDCLKDACLYLVVVGGKTAKRKKNIGNPMGIHSTLKIFFSSLECSENHDVYISFEK